MNPWNDANYPSLDLMKHQFYKSKFTENIVEYKYSPTLFIGSCDIAGTKPPKYWHEIYTEQKQITDYVKLGQPIQSFSGLMRVLYVYLNKVEKKPEKILMVVPMTSQEHVLGDTCYSVNYRKGPVELIERLKIMPESDWELFNKLHQVYHISDSLNERIYNFCKEFSFLEMMCKAHNIELQWTFNLTLSSKAHFPNNDDFVNAHEFAKSTYIGTTECLEYNYVNMCPTYTAHRQLAWLFLESNK